MGLILWTSLAGGVIEYRMGDAANLVRHSWPDDLFYAILWSGRPASTQARVTKFDRSNSNLPSVSALVAAASDVANTWAHQQSTNIIASLGAYTESLYQFNLAHGLGIFDAGHDTLYAASVSTDVLYKPCGAGGGDIGIALGLDASALADYVAEAEKLGFRGVVGGNGFERRRDFEGRLTVRNSKISGLYRQSIPDRIKTLVDNGILKERDGAKLLVGTTVLSVAQADRMTEKRRWCFRFAARRGTEFFGE